jgi:hypothetical protein
MRSRAVDRHVHARPPAGHGVCQVEQRLAGGDILVEQGAGVLGEDDPVGRRSDIEMR